MSAPVNFDSLRPGATAAPHILGMPRKHLAFGLAVAMLVLSALALNTAIPWLRLHFKKQPVPLPRSLAELPPEMGRWVQVSKDQPLDDEMLQVLATDKYIFRDYVDERIVGREKIEAFRNKSHKERREMLVALQIQNPASVISLSLTYYTGMVDTVSHVPDRCYIAGGYEPSSYEVPQWRLGDEQVSVRFITFEDHTGLARQAVPKSVTYFFHVNGRYENSPLAVRKSLQNLRERYGYYAKVELLSLVRDRRECAMVMQDFLSAALPKIKALLPDWSQYQSAR